MSRIGSGRNFRMASFHIDLRGDADHPERSHDVLARFLGALGVPGGAIPDHPADRVALFRSRTADHRILIVLDNAADETQVLPLLPGTVGCAVIITSRVPLAALPGARRFALDVLDADACRRLLEAILGLDRTGAERSNVELLAALCGGLPLALRVAAGRLAAQPHWLVKTLVDRLADERHRLDELRLGGIEVRASLRLSTRALPAADGAAFALLGLLPPGDFASWVLAALLGGSVGEAEERLDVLVRVQLVEYCGRDATGQARYRLHDLIRAYAVELADGRGSSDALAPSAPVPERPTAIDRLHGAWVAYAAQAARRLFPQNVTPVPEPVRPRPVPGTDGLTLSPAAWLESERRSLVAAVRAGALASDPADGFVWQIASLTSVFLETRGYFDDMRSLHQYGLRAAERAGEVRAEAAMRHGLATVDSYEHNLTGARDGYEWALKTYRRLGDDWGCAHAEHGLAKVLRWTGEIDEALAGCDRAIDGFLAAGDGLEASSVRRTAAVIHYERGSWDLAVEVAEQALQGYTRAGDRYGECGVWGVLGLAIARQGDHERAGWYLRSAVNAASELGLVLDRAYAGRALGDLYLAQGHGPRARELFEMGLDVMRTVGSRSGEAGFLRQLARLAAEDGQLDTALTLASRAVDLSKPDGAGLYAHSLWALGDVYAARNDEAAATTAWRQSRELFRQLGSAEGPPEY
jgi:tetratricopeptide (TPR) repeat protein